ncbi:cupin domain-containing protein [Spirosoma areae]
MTAAYYVQTLHMQPHPEGGYFAETYRSAEVIPQLALPERFRGSRPFGTAIYFLLEKHHVSAFHRIHSDEIWHFYAGGPLEIFVIKPDSTLTVIRLGTNLDRGEVFQAVVPAGCWFGARPVVDSTVVDSTVTGTAFSLVGCTVAPGFDFADFDMADRAMLLEEFPQHREVVEVLTL